MSSSDQNANVHSSPRSRTQSKQNPPKKFKSLALAAKVSKRIPGNETLALIKGVNKKVHQPTIKDTLTKDQKENLSSVTTASEKAAGVIEKYNSPRGKVTMTKKRQQEGDPGPKKDVIVNIPNFKSGNSTTKKI